MSFFFVKQGRLRLFKRLFS